MKQQVSPGKITRAPAVKWRQLAMNEFQMEEREYGTCYVLVGSTIVCKYGGGDLCLLWLSYCTTWALNTGSCFAAPAVRVAATLLQALQLVLQRGGGDWCLARPHFVWLQFKCTEFINDENPFRVSNVLDQRTCRPSADARWQPAQ
jgi:hypothetical protein